MWRLRYTFDGGTSVKSVNKQTDFESVDSGESWSVDEFDESKIYAFYGDGAPYGSSAVSKAKKQFADKYDFDFADCVGSSVSNGYGRSPTVVVVVHKPTGIPS